MKAVFLDRKKQKVKCQRYQELAMSHSFWVSQVQM